MRKAKTTPDKGDPKLWFAWYPVNTDRGRRWLTRVWWHAEYGYSTRGQSFYRVRVNRYRAR